MDPIRFTAPTLLNWKVPVFTRTEIRIVSIIVAFLATLVAMPMFQSHFALLCLIGVSLVFLLTARRRIDVSLSAAFCVLMVATYQYKSREAQPLRDPIAARTFVNAPLADVLTYLSNQREDFPVWRFLVWDDALARSNVNLSIPPGATLADVLKSLTEATSADVDWKWNKHCGNEPFPGCALFRIFPRRAPPQGDADAFALMVSRDDLFWTDEEDHPAPARPSETREWP